MKKVFYSLAFVAIVSILSSCSPKPEEMVVGTWTLDGVNIDDIDELAQTVLDMQVGILDQQIAQLEEMTATMPEDTEEAKLEKETYMEQLNSLKMQKDEFNLDSVKGQFTKEFDNLIGNLKFTFNEDKSYKNLLDEKGGSWALNEDATVLTLTDSDSKDVALMISELKADKLAVTIEDGQDEMKMKINMTFVKGDAGSDEETTDEATEEHTEEETH